MDSLLRDLGGANPYTLLGLAPTATDAEIKEARRRLQRQAHPDLVAGDGAAARVINVAADLLLDRDRRLAFDRSAASAPEPVAPRPRHEWSRPHRRTRPARTSEPAPPEQLPPRPGTITTAMWLMYAAAMVCVLFLVFGVFGSAFGGRADVVEGLAIAAVPIGLWLGITVTMGAAIGNGWRGTLRWGWALTLIFLLPIGTGCGAVMSSALSPALAVNVADRESVTRAPELIERLMIWTFPVGLLLAVAAMTLVATPGSRLYLETMADVRGTAQRRIRRHRRVSR